MVKQQDEHGHLQVATSMPNTTWLNWRKVVFSKRGAMVCKSATISVMGFLGWLVLW
jgi:hypothetical protein